MLVRSPTDTSIDSHFSGDAASMVVMRVVPLPQSDPENGHHVRILAVNSHMLLFSQSGSQFGETQIGVANRRAEQ